MREYRGSLTQPGRDSPHRTRSIEENLELFEEMAAGEVEDGAACVRLKIDMNSPNMNLRDPAIYRIKRNAEHPQTGTKWKIYPMYDYAHVLTDAMEGITHSLCTLEFEDHRPLYDWVLDNLPVPARPRQIEFSRLNLQCVPRRASPPPATLGQARVPACFVRLGASTAGTASCPSASSSSS